jgi:hypothetical protein
VNPTRTHRNYRLELDFCRAFQGIPVGHRPSLRAWIRRYRRHRRPAFYQLDPATGQWRRL